jgi:CRP/FNR family transcriptional regulator, cyclic AMP receptor protein
MWRRPYNDGEMEATTPSRARAAGKALLELDPDLGRLLSDERRLAAQHELRVRVTSFPVGEWDGERLADADPTHLGLLVTDGVLAREVVLGDTVSTELLGAGDIVRPWSMEAPQLLAVSVRWNALSAVRLALLDRRVATLIAGYPEINAIVVDRLSERAQRLAITQAISQLNRVDRRLLALFWHLAERWGRVSRDGIAVPLVLSHRLIGELVGARRPTVSTALAELAREHQLVRRDDGTWLLTGAPIAIPPAGESAAELVRQRRRLMPTPQEPSPPEPVTVHPVVAERPSAERLVELRSSLHAARMTSERHREALGVLQAETAALRARTIELRAERTRRIEALQRAATERRAAAHG